MSPSSLFLLPLSVGERPTSTLLLAQALTWAVPSRSSSKRWWEGSPPFARGSASLPRWGVRVGRLYMYRVFTLDSVWGAGCRLAGAQVREVFKGEYGLFRANPEGEFYPGSRAGIPGNGAQAWWAD